MTFFNLHANYWKTHPFLAWVIVAVFFGLCFFHSHIHFRLRQSADYHYLTCKTTFQTDVLVYANFTRSVMRSPGFPSDIRLFEHRGETIFPYVTYTLPCYFAAASSFICGGNIDLGYQLCSFLALLAIVLLLYPFLNELSDNTFWLKLFFISILLCFSSFLRPHVLISPSLTLTWIQSISSRPHYFNEFFRSNNIQISFVFFSVFISSLYMFLKKPESKVYIMFAGCGLAVTFYSYTYYFPQAVLIYILIGLILIFKGNWKTLKYLCFVILVALIFTIPFIIYLFNFWDSQIMYDFQERVGFNRDFQMYELGYHLLGFSIFYAATKFFTKTFNTSALILLSNILSMALILFILSLTSINVQSGHFTARAFYPIFGLALADLAFSFIFVFHSAIAAFKKKWGQFNRKKTGTYRLVLAMLVMLTGTLFFFHYYSIRHTTRNNLGYYTIENDTARLIGWLGKHKNKDDVFLTSDTELIRLLPAEAGSWSFLTVATTSVAETKELLDRLAWGYALLGISPDELNRRMNLGNVRRDFNLDKLRRQTLDYDRFPYSEWGYVHFGRIFTRDNPRIVELLTPEESKYLQKLQNRELYEYVPTRIKKHLSQLHERYLKSDWRDCPYKITYLIISPFDRRDSSLEDSPLKDALEKIAEFGRYEVYRVIPNLNPME